jgi:hypothetical protein
MRPRGLRERKGAEQDDEGEADAAGQRFKKPSGARC